MRLKPRVLSAAADDKQRQQEKGDDRKTSFHGFIPRIEKS
jgi:hypothetical protein